MLLLALLAEGSVHAQNAWQTGAIPSVNLHKGFKSDWALNFKWESRHLFSYGLFGETGQTDYQYILSDISLVASKKIGFRASLAGGYLARIRGSQVAHRLKQQVTFVQRFSSLRLAHRIAADQTFYERVSPEYRFRYRVTTELPFSGQDIDPREFYFKFNNEYLLSLQAKEADLEIRVVPLIGYVITDNHKLEWGVDYRLDSLLGDRKRNAFWLSINWFTRL